MSSFPTKINKKTEEIMQNTKTLKKLIAVIVLVFVYTCSLYSETQPQRPSNYYAHNAGTEANPYLISNLANLRWLSEVPEDWWEGADIQVHFLQTADIDASETVNWNEGQGFNPIGHPIPGSVRTFRGVYNGNEFNISDLFISQIEDSFYIGLFHRIDGSTIKNVFLENINYSVVKYGYILAGGIAASAGSSTIVNCHITGQIFSNSHWDTCVGGIVGFVSRSIIKHSKSEVNINANSNLNVIVGGIAGEVASTTIEYCSTLGEIFAMITSGANGNPVSRAGGIAGNMHNFSTISNCYSMSNVISLGIPYGLAAGIVVYVNEIAQPSFPTENQIKNCYFAGGLVSNGTESSGKAGISLFISILSIIQNCFWDIETSGVTTPSNGIGTIINTFGLPTVEMKQMENYINNGWDFENIWSINPDSYPHLKSFVGSDFITDIVTGLLPLAVQFTDLSVGAVSWSWDFDSDGVIDSTEQNPIFIYEEPGTYTVTLTINDGEDSITKEDYIVVVQPAIADFTAEITQGNAPLEVQFMDMSVGAVSWEWDFGVANDGNRSSLHKLEANVTFQYGYSTEQNPIFIYEEPGTYTVTLTINDGESIITKENFIEATLNDMEGESLPLVTQLKNNFPNPFNPETTISFSLKTAGHVRLEIFNVRGQKVKVLVNDFKEIGSHSVVWNGTDDIGQSVGSGMYFYLMSTDGYSGVKRMILLK